MNLVLYIPLIAIVLLFVLNVYYQYRFWLPFLTYKDKTSVHNRVEQPVSVVLAARNEAENLQKYLPLLLGQDYPDFEVVVVNHCSFDETADVLKDFQAKYERLKVVSIEEQEKYPTGKKFALTLGIKAAKNNILLLTDADCYPATNQWIRLMQRNYVDKTEIVIGYVGVEHDTSLLNLFIQYENVRTALEYLGHAIVSKPFMGRGGNLSYLRTLFFYHKGYVSHIKHPSGDDTLFVNQASNHLNTRICIERDSFTFTKPKTTWSSWNQQKSRHQSSGRYIKTKDLKWLVLSVLIHLLIVPNAIMAVLLYGHHSFFLTASISITALILLNRWVFFVIAGRRLGVSSFVFLLLPLIDIIHPLLQLFWTLKGRFQKTW
jgi:poly-beta-1,6-N-acetyl-D-glucosamine synthase